MEDVEGGVGRRRKTEAPNETWLLFLALLPAKKKKKVSGTERDDDVDDVGNDSYVFVATHFPRQRSCSVAIVVVVVAL